MNARSAAATLGVRLRPFRGDAEGAAELARERPSVPGRRVSDAP